MELEIGKEFAFVTRLTVMKEEWPSLECHTKIDVLKPRNAVKGGAWLDDPFEALKDGVRFHSCLPRVVCASGDPSQKNMRYY